MTTESPKSNNNSGVTKWLVIGAVFIIGFLIFRKPISDLIGRTNDVEVTDKGVRIKTVETPIGELNVSTEEVTQKKATEENTTVAAGFQSKITSDFNLLWPTNWSERPQMFPEITQYYSGNGSLVTPLFAIRNETPDANNIYSTAYVVQTPYNDAFTFESQIDNIVQQWVQRMNATFIKKEIDPATKGAVLVYTFNYYGQNLYQVQRFGYKNGWVIWIVATTGVNNVAAQQQIQTMINSFRIVNG